MNKVLKAHADAIRAGEVTRANVIGLRKAINQAERKSRGYSVAKSAPEPVDVWEVENMLYGAEPKVSSDLHASGLAVLRNKRYAKRLAPYAAIIASIDHFRLVGFTDRYTRTPTTPIYRACSPVGEFDFINRPWQSGGDGPEII